ncbi:glycoside hydrolase family 95 protein [Flectobacillus roseus]|uniref:Glycoside hydrolase N-terminal domain-containing protein n=1 Tax=Flectobacillus roseus TaxID=502259 RepID=A0ABT6YC46_9BACT|nr:glycoside hydrolase N-terminal domain-containing protein [Flectobacillus roseus]MDI9861155.1 glycoside hydrolase N-terminal domain-containing protein [Flectobacillus roseus]
MKKLSFLLLGVFFAHILSAQNYQLWYDKPAQKWTDALPLGNGRIGAMVFGNPSQEHIQFNEETLWTGEPREYNRKDAYQYLGQIRQLLQEGKQKEAEALAEKQFMGLKSHESKRETWIADMLALKGISGNPSQINFDDSSWKTMTVPSYEGWEAIGYEGLDGAVWFRTTIDIPVGWENQSLILDLNRIRDYDYTYINGKLLGSSQHTEGRKYPIPANTLHVGKNLIAIQVLNFSDKGGIAGYKDTSRHIGIYPVGQEDKKISLNGQWKYFIQSDEAPVVGKYQADYQPFGDLYINLLHGKEYQNYRRSLNLATAETQTEYTVDNVVFKREYLVSQPHQVLAVRLSANKTHQINLESFLTSPHKNYSFKSLGNNTWELSVKVRNGGLFGKAYLQIQQKNGSVEENAGKIEIKGADEVIFYLTAATNFINYQNISGNPQKRCEEVFSKLKGISYEQIRKAHQAEYQKYYNRFAIELGQDAKSHLPTDVRLANFGKDNDPSFAALYVQYGRYLLISASRAGTQPSNLQGIWNDLLAPPWGSKYTTNINAEMNYWPAGVLNLIPTQQPLIQMITDLYKAGQTTAKNYYNARGWVVHHNTDLWRGTAPINASNHGIWVSGAGWLSQHLWEHYQYTQDKEFLRKTAYPIMKSASEFFVDFLVKDPKTGWLISTPSNSPEQGGLVAGPSMDHQIIRELYKNTIKASQILGLDNAFADTLSQQYKQIAPNQIGKHGQLQEWLQDLDDPKNNHRHVSHLWGVHPGHDIGWDIDSTMMKAARQSLIYRGDEGTGWSLAWKINFWARFHDGEHALQLVKMLLRPATSAGGSYLNLFDAHPPFQIDGNFGGAAGIAEMLIQSQTDIIELLPALPKDWSEGKVKGIQARGGYILSYAWKNGKITELNITSKEATTCKIRINQVVHTLKLQSNKPYHIEF